MKKKRIYRKTFLTKPVKITPSKYQVDKSFFNWERVGGHYHLSRLGMINDLLTKANIPYALAYLVDDRTNEIKKVRLKKKWW